MTDAANAEANKELVSTVMTAVFIRRDCDAVAKYFSPTYKQHNPAIPDGPTAIPTLVQALPGSFKILLSTIPVRVLIHSSFVSTMVSNSLFVNL